MKAYLITTGLIFGLLTALHIWKATAEWPHPATWQTEQILGAAALVAVTALPAAFTAWAGWLLLKVSNDRTGSGHEPMQKM